MTWIQLSQDSGRRRQTFPGAKLRLCSCECASLMRDCSSWTCFHSNGMGRNIWNHQSDIRHFAHGCFLHVLAWVSVVLAWDECSLCYLLLIVTECVLGACGNWPQGYSDTFRYHSLEDAQCCFSFLEVTMVLPSARYGKEQLFSGKVEES